MDDPKALPAAQTIVNGWNDRGLFNGGAHVVRLPAGTDPADLPREMLRELIGQALA